LNDEFAKDVGDYDSLENLKNEISKGLEEEVKVKNEKEKHSLILQYIIKENPFELPESFINEYVNDMIKQEQKKNPNMSPEDYQKLKQIYGQYTENELKVYYVLEKLREIEKIEVSDKEVDEEIMKSAKKMNMDVEKYKELYKNQLDRETIKISLANEKILKNIEDTVRFVEAK
jgi:trigger factor